MASLIGRVWAWLGGKARLALEYVLLVAFIALAGWSVGTWWQNRATVKSLTDSVTDLSGRLTGVSRDLNTAVGVNKEQDKAIAEVKRLRDLDGQTLDALHDELTKADSRGNELRRKVAELEKNNADAKALLDTAVPPALGCLLDGTPCEPAPAGGDPNPGRDAKAR